MATNDASRMLHAGRPRTERAQRSQVAVVPAPEAQEPDADQETRRPVPQSYEKRSVFIKPDRGEWLDGLVTAARQHGMKGLSVSDFVRMALGHMRAEGALAEDLGIMAAERAHIEAEEFPGRENRGLPARR